MKAKPARRGFPWKKIFFFLFILTGAIVAYDIKKHNSFEVSNVGKFLTDSGTLAFAQRSWDSTKFYSIQGLEYIESTSPEYYKLVVDNTTPYVKLAGDIYVSAKNVYSQLYKNIVKYISTTAPSVAKTIESYAPGLIDSVRNYSLQGFKVLEVYSALIADHVIDYSLNASLWLKTNVFVGNFSPENLQKYASQAINTTQIYASQTYDWVYKKVQTLSKVD